MRYALVVFASRESLGELFTTLNSLTEALLPDTRVEILINGNLKLADAVCHGLPGWGLSFPVRVWHIPFGDKSNAWNQYVHAIWSNEEIAFFIDGYVALLPDSISRLAGGLVVGTELILGGSGVPTMGRSAKKLREAMLRHGGYHGNFCCLKGSTIAIMRSRHLRLPIGLYRTDSLMGALLSFGMHPELNDWNPGHIAVVQNASWHVREKRLWRWSDMSGQLRRILRQGRGQIENAAVKYFLDTKKQPFEGLPADVKSLVVEWQRQAPAELAGILAGSYFKRRCYREMIERKFPHPEEMQPRLFMSS
jgi:hypothetical protein